MKPLRVGSAAITLLLAACHASSPAPSQVEAPAGTRHASIETQASPPLVAAARRQIGVTRLYDPAYVEIIYPGGDVPADRGVCTDVVVRALRANGLDLQQVIHEDMRAHFADYPQNWGLNGPNRNIDHRRVPNQMRWFERQGWSQPISRMAADYTPGDIVAWKLSGSGLLHIGIVSDRKTRNGTPLILHNIRSGTQEEDLLFAHAIIGHYRPSL
ncbi:MAG TPA: DUF1287 domain-containing protein [Pseudoxanthomonas sp.]|nr:DUF1287 domain-containing protein [Pseudoxanthomonas sp.]